MTIQKGSIRLGLARETTEGTAIAAPDYVFGVESGGAVVTPTQDADDLTSGARSTAAVFRGDTACGFDLVGRANLASIGALLYGALGGVATTGASAPYTHVFTIADTLPSFTMFECIVDGEGIDVPRVAGCKVDELDFEWDGNNPLKVTAKYQGRALSFGASDTAAILDEVGITTNFIPAGGTFKLDVDSATAATALVKSGKITLKNSLESDFYSGTITAGGVAPGWHVAECSFTTRPADIDEWRTIITGTTTGSGVAAAPVYGSFEHVFKSQGGVAGHSLKFEGLKVAFMCDLPQAEAGAGAADTELAGMCLMPSGEGASPVKVTLINATASYTS